MPNDRDTERRKAEARRFDEDVLREESRQIIREFLRDNPEVRDDDEPLSHPWRP